MTVLLGSNAANIATPFPQAVLAVKNNFLQTDAIMSFPSPIGDGSSITLSNGGTINFVAANGSTSHSIAATSVNASATLIAAMFLDTVNGLLWVIAGNASAGHGYLASINYTTGSLTTVGTGFTGATEILLGASNGSIQAERASIGSGDLTLWNGTWNFNISTTTGLITVAQSQLMLNSVGQAPGTPNVWYSTLDKTLFAQLSFEPYVEANSAAIVIFRNGRQLTISFDTSGVGGMVGSSGQVLGFPWGVNQVWVTTCFNNSLPIGTQMYNRASFDQWLQNIATSAGMP